MSDLMIEVVNDFTKHYDGCEECGPKGDIGGPRTYTLCSEGMKLSVELLYPNDEAKHRPAPAPNQEAELKVIEAAKAVRMSGAGELPDYANQKSMDRWAIGIKRIVELCAAVDDLSAQAEMKGEE